MGCQITWLQSEMQERVKILCNFNNIKTLHAIIQLQIRAAKIKRNKIAMLENKEKQGSEYAEENVHTNGCIGKRD